MLQISINDLSAIVDYFVDGIEVFLTVGTFESKHALKSDNVIQVDQLQDGPFELSILVGHHGLFFRRREGVPDLVVVDSFELVHVVAALALARCFVYLFVPRVETGIGHAATHVGVALVLNVLQVQLELTVVQEVLVELHLLLVIELPYAALRARVAPALLVKRLVGQS